MTKILIVNARFYEEIADSLTVAAIEQIKSHNFDYEIIEVPGVFELPAAVSMAISSAKYDAYVALGCVIRGETTHYDYVCSESARGLNDLAIKHNAAIGYGVITTENRAQAEIRADKSQKNVGGKAANAAITMLQLNERMNK
jgi:6,7-dimethyl-8-ribityllumazine synthase